MCTEFFKAQVESCLRIAVSDCPGFPVIPWEFISCTSLNQDSAVVAAGAKSLESSELVAL